jgi:hypothetical protein
LAVKLQESEVAAMSGGGRVAALLREEGSLSSAQPAAKSIYRADPSETSSPASSSASRYGAASSSYSSPRAGAAPTGESFQARDKYSTAKGISSDQFFGRDEDHANEMRGRLDKYAGASAISSDMVYHNAEPVDYSAQDGSHIDLDRLKDNVKDFFSDMMR